MKGLILAAGRGSRMGLETAEQPKCFTTLAGRRLLDWQLDALANAKIAPVSIVTGYQAECLHETYPWLSTFSNHRWQESNMVRSLACAGSFLAESSTIISYSDIVFHSEIVTLLSQTPGEIVIAYDQQWLALWSLRFEDPLLDAESFQLDATGQLRCIGQKPTQVSDSQGQYMGLLKITPKGWLKIQSYLSTCTEAEKDHMDMTGLLSRLLTKGVAIQTCAISGRWCEVDSLSDRDCYEFQLAQSQKWTHDWRFDYNDPHERRNTDQNHSTACLEARGI